MGVGVGAFLRAHLPWLTEDWWERAAFDLSYRAHGGSGLGRTYAELLDMNADHIQRDCIRLIAERDAIRDAFRGKG